ncbi:helix-turn-helix domain-containing protein [Clostridium sp. OF09-36]|uniref:helix-turn-helix domain-containing protein n=1 Tax=Clostridium sp. OF09-36 TaxID=2292310 RepID=UPI000E4A0221|nr:helix-turn-helix domain-containing protein [Clostridium sp. OF09-36]RHV86216.1 helix-turn-helix domain-containing protein [Clostridium sp. OF09-36]
MTQGERVREIRKALGLTLEKFGDKLGVGKTAISKIEKGENALTDQMAKSICREFNVSYDYLIYGDGEMFDNLPQTILDELCQQYDLDDLDRQIIDLYVSFPKELRGEIKKRIREKFGKE